VDKKRGEAKEALVLYSPRTRRELFLGRNEGSVGAVGLTHNVCWWMSSYGGALNRWGSVQERSGKKAEEENREELSI
jgi:hypothetical protein